MAPERQVWNGELGFLLVSLAYTIGLGNLWRFPYNCFRHGGGAFLIPYLFMVVLAGVPMLFLEYSLGQFTSQCPLTAWRMSRLFVGLGWAGLLNTAVTCIYYVVLVMYAMYYLIVAVVSIGGPLPWQECGHAWNTDLCYDSSSNASIALEGDHVQCTAPNQAGCVDIQSSAEQYWIRFVLGVHESEGMDDIGSLVGRNVFMLIIMWVIIYLCARNGVYSIGKVVYVTATFPICILLILLVRGLTLPGSGDGISYFIVPTWSKLGNLEIWGSAATQAMFSLGPTFGAHITLSSHSKFHNNVFRDTLIVTIGNVTTSLLSGFVVFSLLGFRAHSASEPVENIRDYGPGLMFVTYSEGLSLLPGAAVWAFLFFLMVFTLGVDSQFVMVWVLADSIRDFLPDKFEKERVRQILLFALCLTALLLALPQTTQGGIYFVTMLDSYNSNFNVIILMILQSVAVGWVYGAQNFRSDVEMMIGRQSTFFWLYWRGAWMITTPVFCSFLLIAAAVGYATPTYDGETLPGWAEALGWMIILLPLVAVVVGAAITIHRHKSLREACRPDSRWGPRHEEHRTGRYMNHTYLHPLPSPEPCYVNEGRQDSHTKPGGQEGIDSTGFNI